MTNLRTGHYRTVGGGIAKLTVTKTGWLITHKDGSTTEVKRESK